MTRAHAVGQQAMESVEAGGFGLVEPLTSEDPRKVAGYQLRARLGAGGMGRVYLAFTRGGRAVAIKVLRAEFGDEEEFRDRFRREVVAAQRVHGMYAAQVLDADPDAPQPWLATAYVPGLSLRQAVNDYGPLPAHSVFLLVAGIAEALQAIHAVGIVHRDLKPSNVILAADGPRVIDFGIARAIAAPALTRGDVRIGSPRFMAPEQARSQPVTPAVDVFALGSLATYAVAGRPPFGVGGAVAVLYRVLNEAPDLGGCPADLRPLIERCLAKDPVQRPRPAEIIDTCQARMTEGALAFDGSWLPAVLSAVAVAPLAALVPGRGSARDDVNGTEPSFSGENSGAGALAEDTYSSVVRDPPERPVVAGPVADSPVAVRPAAGAGGPGGGDGRPRVARRTIIRTSAAVFGLVTAIAAAVVLLPGAANRGTGHHQQAAGGHGPKSASVRASPAAAARSTPAASPAASPVAPHPSPSGAGAAPPPAAASPSAAPAPVGRAAFGGTWSGTVSQPAWTVPSWTVTLVIPAAGGQGSYSAPSLGCSGTLSVQNYTDTTMRAMVDTTSPVNSGCVSKAHLTLSLSGSAEMSMTWVPVGRSHKEPGTAALAGG